MVWQTEVLVQNLGQRRYKTPKDTCRQGRWFTTHVFPQLADHVQTSFRFVAEQRAQPHPCRDDPLPSDIASHFVIRFGQFNRRYLPAGGRDRDRI